MAKRDESYAAKAIIVDHFDTLINKIDIQTEELLIESSNDTNKLKLNQQRQELLEKIKEIEDLNLKSILHTEKRIEEKWTNLIENKLIKYEEKIDILKLDLIKVDCIIKEDDNFEIKLSVWITNWYNRRKDLDFLKYFDSNGSIMFKYFENPENENFIEIDYLNKSSIKNFCILHYQNKPVGIVKDFRFLSLDSIKSLDINYYEDLMEDVKIKCNKVEKCVFENLAHLENLRLSCFEIQEIESSFIKNLAHLEEIDLSSNNLTQIESSMFQGLINLEHINLSYNSLESIDLKTFYGLKKLKVLKLNHNKLNLINKEHFAHLENLETLCLSRNKLTKLDQFTFENLTNLQDLYLRENKIAFLASETFKGLINLRDLDISFNILPSFSAESVSCLKSLKTLNLNHNNLNKLALSTFNELDKLIKLELFCENLEEIDLDGFTNIEKLETLILPKLFCHETKKDFIVSILQRNPNLELLFNCSFFDCLKLSFLK